MTDRENQNKNSWNIVLMAIYFFIPFYGLRIAAENYLMEDDLEISYNILFGLIGGVAVSIYLTTLNSKKLKIKLIGLGIILFITSIINLLVS